jgi:isochorismate hydrolase
VGSCCGAAGDRSRNSSGNSLPRYSADAFYRGYRVIVPTDAVEAFTAEDHEGGLEYLKKVYGAELSSVDEVLGSIAEQITKV